MNKKLTSTLLVLFIGIAIGYGLSLVYPIDIPGKKVEYKNAYGAAEIPVSWSMAALGDAAPIVYQDFIESGALLPHVDTRKLGYSIAQNQISHGDLNWSQIDMASAEGNDLKRVVQELKSQPIQDREVWTTETVDGKHADVLTFALDENGEATKGGTGGKVYFITWDDQGLYMWKQALGDEEFEKGFVHFLETLDLDY